MSTQPQFWTISFSGAGLLLSYHLGAAKVLLQNPPVPLPIRAVAGSSSGAIAATLLSLLPHRLDEYTDRFLYHGGAGLGIMKDMIQSEPIPTKSTEWTRPDLFICATKSSDGSMHLFRFDPTTERNMQQSDLLLRAIQASCMIPKSFHPHDVFSKQRPTFPDGIEIDGELYCDGGISESVPPTPMDSDPHCSRHIIISPISGPTTEDSTYNSIRPLDHSLALPFTLTCRSGSFRIKPSLQNLRAAVASVGATTPNVLRDWYQRGIDDTLAFLDGIEKNVPR